MPLRSRSAVIFKVSRHEQKLRSAMTMSVQGLIVSMVSSRCRIDISPRTGVQGTQSVTIEREVNLVEPKRRVGSQC